MAAASEFPNELATRPLGLIALMGLSITQKPLHKAIWESFSVNRRVSLSSDLFNDIVPDINHKLAGLLLPKAVHHRQLRSNRKFNVPVCKTDRLKKSFIVSHSLRM
ncbi:hypothetical protein P5673_000632 [Acropora cervicornis]|uniref:Uncharacterized protein n=1 Tax=Acropora cervicornis TaxID=6130 RepID=A0AAD9R7B1_ACRCE|nr:hypothetical protein P5673_000632 [Acropora cervicornis]